MELPGDTSGVSSYWPEQRTFHVASSQGWQLSVVLALGGAGRPGQPLSPSKDSCLRLVRGGLSQGSEVQQFARPALPASLWQRLWLLSPPSPSILSFPPLTELQAIVFRPWTSALSSRVLRATQGHGEAWRKYWKWPLHPPLRSGLHRPWAKINKANKGEASACSALMAKWLLSWEAGRVSVYKVAWGSLQSPSLRNMRRGS